MWVQYLNSMRYFLKSIHFRSLYFLLLCSKIVTTSMEFEDWYFTCDCSIFFDWIHTCNIFLFASFVYFVENEIDFLNGKFWEIIFNKISFTKLCARAERDISGPSHNRLNWSEIDRHIAVIAAHEDQILRRYFWQLFAQEFQDHDSRENIWFSRQV